MITENWKEEFRKLWGVDKGGNYWNDPDCSALQMIGFISTLLSKERNEAYEKGFTTGRQGVELERNKVIEEVRNEVEKFEFMCDDLGGAEAISSYKLSDILENLKVK